MPNLQLNNLKSGIENGTQIALKHLSHFAGNSNDAQVLKIRKAFADGLSTNIKLSKTLLSKIIQLEDDLSHYYLLY